ncbi:PLP-dependent aminotransferase family protein [Slackia heliotrinireducens]|uniref:MocR-like pyridoxine biosynthesis transcription factor PdxR n=1 Tax=Slackia heliotrinireducens TaxID=84110 RepID=UPI003315702D
MARSKQREIMLSVDEDSAEPLYRQIYRQVSGAIVDGSLAAGDRLPSIRKLCGHLGVSHTTVEQAYLQLAVEGYVRNMARSGYVVEKLDTGFLQMTRDSAIEKNVQRSVESRSQDAFFAENLQGGQALYDFSYANLPDDSFPVKTWYRLVGEMLHSSVIPELGRYAYTSEPNELSRQICAYLKRARGVNCVPEQVIPQSGTDGSLATVFQLFSRERHTVGLEEPGYATVREVAQRMGFDLVPLPSDCGMDAYFEALERYRPKIVFCTPSHQFPTGHIMAIDARTRLLKWAQQNNAYIIEDDSCNEYRYETAPIPSLQSLDAYSRVIYMCNVSKVLSPSMRVAYLVLPPKLLGRYFRLFNYAHPSIPWLEQEVLARFMAEGYWDQHIRRMTKLMRKRHDALLSGLTDAFGDSIRISGQHSGMHLYVSVPNGMTQQELISSARREGAAVYGTQRMWFSRSAPEESLMVGFSSIKPEDIPAGVEALARAWRR